MGSSHCNALRLSKMQNQMLVPPHWCSFLGCGNEHVDFLLTYKDGQYFHCRRMWQSRPYVAKRVRPNLIDAPLMLTLKTYQQSLDAQQLYPKMHTMIFDSQYIVSVYHHLHPEALRLLNYWSTTIHCIWAMNDEGPSCISNFGLSFNANRSIHQWLIYMDWLPHVSSSSSYSLSIMTYHKECGISRHCAPALSGELCSWMHGSMHRHDHHSSRFALHIDHSIYDLYDITYLNYVSKDWVYFSFCFLA